jgi:hypothetical protein
MKKSIGNDSQKFVRDARKATRACFAISGGGGLPEATDATVMAMTFFLVRPDQPPDVEEHDHGQRDAGQIFQSHSLATRRPGVNRSITPNTSVATAE